MENLLRSSRARHLDRRQGGGGGVLGAGTSSGVGREKRTAARRTVQFKEERKKAQNWFQRQLSRQSSEESEMERAVAVGTMAYAIDLLTTAPESSHSRSSSGSHEIYVRGEGWMKSIKRPGKKSPAPEDAYKTPPEDFGRPASSTIQETVRMSDETSGSSDGDITGPEPYEPPPRPESPPLEPKRAGEKTRPGTMKPDLPPEVPPASQPTMTKPPSRRPSREETEAVQPTAARPPSRRTSRDGTQEVQPTATRPPSRRPSQEETEADTWEKAQLEKIRKRYEKISKRILAWELKKREKAKKKLEKSEGESQEERNRAFQKFRKDASYIDQIIAEARAQADARRRNEELKVQDKANVIRATGKVPKPSCLCL